VGRAAPLGPVQKVMCYLNQILALCNLHTLNGSQGMLWKGWMHHLRIH